MPFPPPGDLPASRIKHESSVAPALQAGSLPLGHWGRLTGLWLATFSLPSLINYDSADVETSSTRVPEQEHM